MVKEEQNEPIHYEVDRSNKANYLYHQYDENLTFGKHLHNSFEILVLQEGKLTTIVGSRSFTLKPGEAIIIFPNQVHSYQSEGYSKSQLLIFSPDIVPHYSQAIAGKEYENPVITESLIPLLNKLQPGNNPYLNKGYAYELVGLIDSHCRLQEIGSANSSLLQYIAKYVKANFSQAISLRSLADKTGYSYHYLSSLFNRSFGLNFSRYVNLFRVEEAAFLLSSSEESITEIAFGCGFQNVRSFNREFLSLKGLSPSSYRLNSRSPRGKKTAVNSAETSEK